MQSSTDILSVATYSQHQVHSAPCLDIQICEAPVRPMCDALATKYQSLLMRWKAILLLNHLSHVLRAKGPPVKLECVCKVDTSYHTRSSPPDGCVRMQAALFMAMPLAQIRWPAQNQQPNVQFHTCTVAF